MPGLILGPLLRYAGPTEATVWVETDAACEITVLGHAARTFCVEGHHYAIVRIEDLAPGTRTEYSVALDGHPVWPEPDSPFPPSVIRTPAPDAQFRLAFGSCRVCVPHHPPWTLTKEQDERGREVDALHALATRMSAEDADLWPDALLMLGDQIYADEVSLATRDFIHSRRDVSEPPGEEVADFEEYTHLYHDSWGEPVTRWLLSTVPSVMIFDDHDVHDDWNISAAWVRDMRERPWWEARITGGFMSYWIYQHLGNLSPRELDEDALYARVRRESDAGALLRDFAHRASREPAKYRWSVYRDFGRTRLIVMDSRAGRVLEEGGRRMTGEDEWAWIEERSRGDFDHVLLGTSVPFILGPGVHFLEAWNEAVCAGAWGPLAARIGERIRRKLDLDHWSAFGRSFADLGNLIRAVARGERGAAPATIVALSGDVHHAYLAGLEFPGGGGAPAYQVTASPMRNSLSRLERSVVRAGWSRGWTLAWKWLARLAGVGPPALGWRLLHDRPWFVNQVATLDIDGRGVRLRIEKPVQVGRTPRLEQLLDRRLSGPAP